MDGVGGGGVGGGDAGDAVAATAGAMPAGSMIIGRRGPVVLPRPEQGGIGAHWKHSDFVPHFLSARSLGELGLSDGDCLLRLKRRVLVDDFNWLDGEVALKAHFRTFARPPSGVMGQASLLGFWTDAELAVLR